MKIKFFLATLGIAIFTLILVIGIAGCEEVQRPSAELNYFPHEDGYRWEYQCSSAYGISESSSFKRIRYFDGTATLPNSFIVQNFVCTEEALSQSAMVFGTVKLFGLPISRLGSTYLFIDETGVYSYGNPYNPTTEAGLILPLPLSIGKVWKRGHAESILTCEAFAAEEVTVPAGTYNTVKIRLKIGTAESDYWYEWYADGVGMVKSSAELLTQAVTLEEVNGELRIIPITGESVVWYFTEELLSKNF